MPLRCVALGALLHTGLLAAAGGDTPCLWSSPAGGATFDLRPLTAQGQGASSAKSYYILDGDIPCTPETEPAFSYTWNFCADVTGASLPGACSGMGKSGVALQYLQLDGGFSDCYIIGKYDAARDDLHYNLLNPADPSKGVLLTYPHGERCANDPTGAMRSTTIEVQCANTKTTVVSAQSPASCQYRLVTKSLYGCPTECLITSNGLCNSHGHCAYDVKSGTPYCYCNEGFYGAACDSATASAADYRNDVKAADKSLSVQIGLMITLLIVVVILVVTVAYMAYSIRQFRKHGLPFLEEKEGSSRPGSTFEMVDAVSFN